MISGGNILNTPSSKRPYSYENSFSNRKHKGSLTPSKVIPSSPIPQQQQQQRKSSIININNVYDINQHNKNKLTTLPNKNNLFKVSREEKEKEKEKENKEKQINPDDIIDDGMTTTNETVSRIELERDELKNKMYDLKKSYQQRIQILVKELEKYKKNGINNNNDVSNDEINQLKKERDQLKSFIDQLITENLDQATQIKNIEYQLNDQHAIVEKLEEENITLKHYHQSNNNNNKADDDHVQQQQQDKVDQLEEQLSLIKEDLEQAILQNNSTFVNQESYIQLLENERHQLENKLYLLQDNNNSHKLDNNKDELIENLEINITKMANHMREMADQMKEMAETLHKANEEILERKELILKLKQENTEKEEMTLTLNQEKEDLKQNYDDLQYLYLQNEKSQQQLINKLTEQNDLLEKKYNDALFEMKQKHVHLLSELNLWKQRARKIFE